MDAIVADSGNQCCSLMGAVAKVCAGARAIHRLVLIRSRARIAVAAMTNAGAIAFVVPHVATVAVIAKVCRSDAFTHQRGDPPLF